jgi:hypothetical protein
MSRLRTGSVRYTLFRDDALILEQSTIGRGAKPMGCHAMRPV